MSVAAAGGAVSTHHYQPTAEQIRLAQLIEDKKHDQPEVQEIIRKVLDVVANSSQEEALVALFDCDYDYEKAVALLIEKGHDIASEWRTATNHKLTKKQQQQQQKLAATKNEQGDFDENGQQLQRGYDNFPSRGKSRGNRSRQPQNGGDSQTTNNNNNNNSQHNENYFSQQRQRGNNGYRGRYRANHRGGFRGTDRNSQQQQQQQQQNQDSNIDSSSSSDINRRNRGTLQTVTQSEQQQQQQQDPDQWDVGNWNGETLIYSRTTKDDEQPPSSSTATHADESSKVPNGQSVKPEFDPIEVARQIKNVIGIGQVTKTSQADTQQQQQQQQQKSKSTTGQTLNLKATPSPTTQTRIPQQPVIFSDRYEGGINKIDVQFGSLGESFDESSTTFYPQTESIASKKTSQRTIEQSTNISPSRQPVINQQQQQQQPQQQRVVPTQIQSQPQPTPIPIKPVVTSQYTVQQQHQLPSLNIPLQSLLFHPQQQQPEPVTLDTSYDPTPFSLPSMDFNSAYFMAPPPMTQPQTHPRYLVSQPPPVPPPQQQTSAKNAQTSAGSPSTVSTTTAKKAPAIPPGMFPPTGPPPPIPQQAPYSTAYNVQQQQQAAATSYPYDTEHLFTNSFMPLANPQQTQSPTGTYGSVTPPVQQQNPQQQTNNNNDHNKTMNYRPPPPINDNLMLLQQYQQFALQQPNNQQQGQQPGTHSPATLSYFLSHPPSGPNYSPGHQIMYAQAATAMAQQQQQQQQASKQQGQQYNQNNPSTGLNNADDYYNRNSSANKDGQYIYATNPQTQHMSQQSTGQQQQQGVNKQQQQQQRPSGNVYNNQQRPYQ